MAVYVRVSTDSVQQTSSYELQKNYYTSFVESHKNWRLVRIYADEGISGTSLNHRDAFNKMIDDCSRGEIDLILTKSVSRFARNIVDYISMVRRLRSLHPPVGVYFEVEHIFTLKNDTDMSLAFIATMAEEESFHFSSPKLFSDFPKLPDISGNCTLIVMSRGGIVYPARGEGTETPSIPENDIKPYGNLCREVFFFFPADPIAESVESTIGATI